MEQQNFAFMPRCQVWAGHDVRPFDWKATKERIMPWVRHGHRMRRKLYRAIAATAVATVALAFALAYARADTINITATPGVAIDYVTPTTGQAFTFGSLTSNTGAGWALDANIYGNLDGSS